MAMEVSLRAGLSHAIGLGRPRRGTRSLTRFAEAMGIILLAMHGLGRAQNPELMIADFEQVLEADGSFVLPTSEGFSYAELQWHGVYVVDGDHSLTDQFPESGYRTGRVSGRYVAVAGSRGVEHSMIRPIVAQRFDFRSAYFTAVWRNSLRVRIEAKRGREIVAVREATVDTTRPVLVEIDFTDVDEVLISASGGEDAGACRSAACRSGPGVVLDDVRFSLSAELELTKVVVVPEPSSDERPTTASIADRPVEAAPTTSHSDTFIQEPSSDALVRESSSDDDDISDQSAPEIETCGGNSYYGVQAGAFRSSANAANLSARLQEAHGAAQVHVKETTNGQLYFVIAGCFEERDAAAALSDKLKGAGEDGIVVRASASRFGPRLSR